MFWATFIGRNPRSQSASAKGALLVSKLHDNGKTGVDTFLKSQQNQSIKVFKQRKAKAAPDSSATYWIAKRKLRPEVAIANMSNLHPTYLFVRNTGHLYFHGDDTDDRSQTEAFSFCEYMDDQHRIINGFGLFVRLCILLKFHVV
jgi:hypothetical protein